MGTKKTLDVGDLILFLVLYFPKDPNSRVLSKFSKRREPGVLWFPKFTEDQNQRTFDLQNFPKDWNNNRRFSGLVISQNFHKTGNHQRVFDFPSLLDPGGLWFSKYFGSGGFLLLSLFSPKDGTGGYEQNQITALKLVQIPAPCVPP